MIIPTLQYEKNLFLKGARVIAGLDEAGRGAWAGPIVAGAVLIISPKFISHDKKIIIRDSKLLSAQQRMRAYEFLTQNFECAFGIVESEQIDSIGIRGANQLAMDYALAKLSLEPDYALVDGRGFYFNVRHENIIDGDAKVFCIAAASIIAKVVRDEIMKAYDVIFPNYGFYRHKGYGTQRHQETLKKHGVCPIHRRSYSPIKRLLGR